MGALSNINAAMNDRRLRDRMIASAAFLKLPHPEQWVEEHFRSSIGELLGTGSDSLADLHVAGLAAAEAAYEAVVTDGLVNAAVQQRLQFIGQPFPGQGA